MHLSARLPELRLLLMRRTALLGLLALSAAAVQAQEEQQSQNTQRPPVSVPT